MLNLKPAKVYKDQSLASMDFLPAESVHASQGYHTCDKVFLMFFLMLIEASPFTYSLIQPQAFFSSFKSENPASSL